MISKAKSHPNSQASFGAFYYSQKNGVSGGGADPKRRRADEGDFVWGPSQIAKQPRRGGCENTEVATRSVPQDSERVRQHDQRGSLDNIVINCNTKEQLLSQNRWKLNRQLKQSLVVSGVIDKQAVKNCLTTSSFPEIEIHLPKNKSKSIIKNIHTCKNFWKCPVCRGNALHKKREEIQQVVEKSKTKNIMATFTIRHDRKDKLMELVNGLQSASSDLWRDRVWKALKKKYLFEWQVRNLEVTWGIDNGWHAHIHTLIGSMSDAIDIAHIEGELFRAWDRLVQKYGLKPLDKQAGVNVVPADSADTYIVKWVIGKEMAGYKSGRKGNVSIGDLEMDILQYSLSPRHEGYVSENQTKALLREYHSAFEKRKFMQPGGKYNEILGKINQAKEEQEQEEEKVDDDRDIVFVKTGFWTKLHYSGYAFDFLSVLEERGVVEGIDWLERRVKNPETILQNIRVEERCTSWELAEDVSSAV